jgi:hypothetical protein
VILTCDEPSHALCDNVKSIAGTGVFVAVGVIVGVDVGVGVGVAVDVGVGVGVGVGVSVGISVAVGVGVGVFVIPKQLTTEITVPKDPISIPYISEPFLNL